MTLDYKSILVEIVERLGQFAADRRALITILAENGISGWESRLAELRQVPDYKVIAARYRLLLKQAEVDADFRSLAQLMQELDQDKPPN